ncbi:YhcH/YjgK/YiaL family protein [Tatumella citrea]|uniref:YhcH/YjgK/YiaL family protein n=1 Tax=Tatumella citrea TaxID=53336 RepID=A0A1Y0L426_TATCI|nr:YhcH/YjgK/YiaL family protein [Tatumella citrea]ARU92776.1 hypothetical protein A7K98_02590 [Tatumella citrea]ARU96814.1 hypothetical protein A7K99_02590 [Tatumella citrea]
MIFGHISRPLTCRFPDVIMKGLDFLRGTDFTFLPAGRIEIDGENMFAQVLDLTTAPIEENKPESHYRYLDIQFLASGCEKIGVTINSGKNKTLPTPPGYKDIVFYSPVENESFLTMEPGSFAIFFPEDIHRPACAIREPLAIRKVVVKIDISQL